MIVEPIAFENDTTIKIDGGGIAFTLRARENKDPQCVMTYQSITGPLMASGYSKNGTQEAMNGMYITSADRGGREMISCYGGGETAQTLDASYYKGPGARNGKEREIVAIQEPTYMSNKKDHNGITEDGTATTLNAQEKERPLVAVDVYNQSIQGETAANVTAETGVPNHSGPKLMGQSIVRRLTPLECERLQGMPDDWSRWGVNEKGEVYELLDSARYRLQGNGIATPFWKYLLKRISAQYERDPTMGSLFDGQASFPMLWEGINGQGTCLWSSEIEKHAVAVAKYHFPEDPET